MNAFERGFYSELEKTAGKVGRTIGRTMLGSALGGLTGTALMSLLRSKGVDVPEENGPNVDPLVDAVIGGTAGSALGGTAGLISGLMSKDKKTGLIDRLKSLVSKK